MTWRPLRRNFEASLPAVVVRLTRAARCDTFALDREADGKLETERGMTTTSVCQSCAMPLAKAEDFGTEAGDARADEYCTHCYQGGSFPAPDVTMPQMADIVAGFVEGVPKDQATEEALANLSGLKRWRAA